MFLVLPGIISVSPAPFGKFGVQLEYSWSTVADLQEKLRSIGNPALLLGSLEGSGQGLETVGHIVVVKEDLKGQV